MKIKGMLIAMFSGCVISFGQDSPTLVSYELDTICEGNYGLGVFNLIVEDINNDSTYIEVTYVDPSLVGSTWVYVPDSYDPGSSMRTFTIEIFANYGIPAGVSLTDMDITIHGGGLDDFPTYVTLNDIAVRQGPVVTADFSSLVLCSNGLPFDASPYVSPDGGTFQYDNGAQTTFFDPQIFYAYPGDGFVYTYTDAFGCSADVMDYPAVGNAPSVSVSANSSSCGNADGSAVATIIGDAIPFDVYWTTGFSETVTSSSIVNNLSSGNYYINVVDANGCKAVGLAQVSDGDLDVTETITDETCINQSFNGAIDLNVLSTNGSVDFISWNNGETTEDLTGLKAGDYSVQIHTDANCQGFYTFTVGSLPKLGITIDNMLPADCNFPDGGNSAIEITTTGGSGSFAWAWSNGATTEDLYSIPSGLYTCVVTDALTGCSWSWTTDLESFNGPYISVDNIIKPNCNVANGAVEVSIWSPTQIIFTSWNTGQISDDLNGIPAGNYELSVMDVNGCQAQKLVKVVNEKPYQPSICLLTVDTSLVYNMVVWEKDITQDVAGFNIYRETANFGEFEKVAQRPYGLESFYQDNLASPVDRSWRYYLTTYDDCGGESFASFIHKTIHVVANTSNGTDYELNWDDYEGIGYSSVDLHRFDPINGWITIGPSLSAGTNTFSDTPPVIAGLDYLVTFNLTDPCTSTKVQDHNSSRSNKSSSVFNPGGSTAEITDEELGYISIYPNPASEMITLHIDMPELFQQYEIRNLNGDLVSSGTIFTNNTLIPVDELSSGVYLLHLVSDSKIITEKFIKN